MPVQLTVLTAPERARSGPNRAIFHRTGLRRACISFSSPGTVCWAGTGSRCCRRLVSGQGTGLHRVATNASIATLRRIMDPRTTFRGACWSRSSKPHITAACEAGIFQANVCDYFSDASCAASHAADLTTIFAVRSWDPMELPSVPAVRRARGPPEGLWHIRALVDWRPPLTVRRRVSRSLCDLDGYSTWW